MESAAMIDLVSHVARNAKRQTPNAKR